MVKTVLPLRGGTGSIPGQGTEMPHAARCGQEKKKKEIIRVKLIQKGFSEGIRCWVLKDRHTVQV